MAQENDVVLIYFEDKPLIFARIEQILADHKPGWYHVKLLMLQIPLQTVTWILKNEYINGDEFTMNGKRMRMELVISPKEMKYFQETEIQNNNIKKENEKNGENKIISLKNFKKK